MVDSGTPQFEKEAKFTLQPPQVNLNNFNSNLS